jgi:hypothetical protein
LFSSYFQVDKASPDNFGKDVIDVPDGISMHRMALVFEKRPVMIH